MNNPFQIVSSLIRYISIIDVVSICSVNHKNRNFINQSDNNISQFILSDIKANLLKYSTRICNDKYIIAFQYMLLSFGIKIEDLRREWRNTGYCVLSRLLQISCTGVHIKIINCLVSEGLSFDDFTIRNFSTLGCVPMNGNMEILEYIISLCTHRDSILDHIVLPNGECEILQTCAYYGRIDMFNYIISLGINIKDHRVAINRSFVSSTLYDSNLNIMKLCFEMGMNI